MRCATSRRSPRPSPTRWARWPIPPRGSKSIKDVVERAKANPGQLNYGSFGIGNMTHLQGVLLSLAADIKMTHVPYRGQTPAITDVLGGQIPLGFTTTAGVTDLVESGKLNLLATFGQERDEQFPNTPTPYEARLSERGRGRLGRPARAGRHADADHRQAARRHGEGAGACPTSRTRS